MSYQTEKDKKIQIESVANANSLSSSSDTISSYFPPPLQFSKDNPIGLASNHNEHNYAADYQRLLDDDINFVNESYLVGSNIVHEENHDDYRVYVHNKTHEPWFVGEKGNMFYQPYTQGYRDMVMPKKETSQQKYIEFYGAKLKLLSEGSPLTVDSGGTIGVNGNKVGFSFNVSDGGFSITTDLLPLGELSGNIWKFPSCGLQAEFKPQLGFITLDPSNYSFEIELTIPGAPLSPAIILSGKLNQQLIKEDWENLITRDFFPFIGEIIDALET